MAMKLIRLKPYIPSTIFIFVLIAVMGMTYVPYPNIIRLSQSDYPNEHVPSIVAPGEYFKISTSVEKVWVGFQELKNEQGTIKIPEDFSPGWYNLTLQINGINTTRNNSIYVTPISEDDFTFIQVTDVHTPCYDGADVQERKNVFNLVNDIGPAFVVDTGDMTDYGLEKQYVYYGWIISDLEMPLYTIPGNMETYSDPNLERYASHLGPGNYYFYFGRILFVASAALHSPRSWGGFVGTQIKWINDTISKEADLKFLLHHIPIVAEQGRDYNYVPWGWKEGHFSQIEEGYEEIVKILKKEKAYVLSGHWHGYSNKFQYEAATFYNTPSVTRMSEVKEGPRFRLFQIQNNTITYDKVIKSEKLHITHQYTTNNTQVKIIIRNEEGFYVPLYLHVKLSPLKLPYSTNQGEIIKYSSSGDIWVKYNAPIGESEIEVAPII
jgi:hypothetical protein